MTFGGCLAAVMVACAVLMVAEGARLALAWMASVVLGRWPAVLLVAIVALSCPALAEDPATKAPPIASPAEDAATEEAPRESPFTAAAWCAVTKSDTSEGPGCDVGLGVSLARYGRLRWVAVVGAQTLGTGVAWVPWQRRGGPVIAVAAGVVLSYDAATGIDRELHLALGATVALGGVR